MNFIKVTRSHVIILTLVIAGCDPMTTSRSRIMNQSKHDLYLVEFTKSDITREAVVYDSLLVKANQTILISEGSGLGGGGCLLPDSMAAIVKDADNLIVIKDLTNSDFWLSSRKGNSFKGFQFECHATITDADIVSK